MLMRDLLSSGRAQYSPSIRTALSEGRKRFPELQESGRQSTDQDGNARSFDIPSASYGSENEGENDVDLKRPEGYCAVAAGEKFKGGRYTALEKIGSGHFSTVWLCYDWLEMCVVGIKFQRDARNYNESAKHEISFLREVKRRGGRGWPIVELLDHFEHYTSTGRHVCLVFEVLSKSLLSLIKKSDYRGLPLPLVRRISRYVLEGLFFLHYECRIIHTDIKPENILIVPMLDDFKAFSDLAAERARALDAQPKLESPRVPSKSSTGNQSKRSRVKKSFLSCVLRSSEETEVLPQSLELYKNASWCTQGGGIMTKSDAQRNSHSCPRSLLKSICTDRIYSRGVVKIIDLGNALRSGKHSRYEIQTRQYRSPEVILGAQYDSSADIWSAACLIFELATGEYLFEPLDNPNYSRDEDHLALMMELLGAMPEYIALRGRNGRAFFNRNAQLRHIKQLHFCPLEMLLVKKYHFSERDAKLLSSFLLPMLHFDPARRATAQQCLLHPFLAEEEKK